MPGEHDLRQATSPVRRSEPAPIGYWAFYDEVARRQLVEWLPEHRSRVLDVSGGSGLHSATVAAAGHDVVRVLTHTEPPLEGHRREPDGIRRVVGDAFGLDWLRPGSVDAVVAESGALSAHLAAEVTLPRLREALRPGGRLLLCVDSLVLGLARLAQQGAWAQLADVPNADVVLVPHEDGSVTRCFWAEEVVTELERGGFDVEWVRPRTVLSQDAVEHALAADPSALGTLVRTELALAREREDQAIGIHLVAAARRAG